MDWSWLEVDLASSGQTKMTSHHLESVTKMGSCLQVSHAGHFDREQAVHRHKKAAASGRAQVPENEVTDRDARECESQPAQKCSVLSVAWRNMPACSPPCMYAKPNHRDVTDPFQRQQQLILVTMYRCALPGLYAMKVTKADWGMKHKQPMSADAKCNCSWSTGNRLGQLVDQICRTLQPLYDTDCVCAKWNVLTLNSIQTSCAEHIMTANQILLTQAQSRLYCRLQPARRASNSACPDHRAVDNDAQQGSQRQRPD